MWVEVAQAAEEGRHELVLHGKTVQERIEKDGIDQNIFQLEKLNFLEIRQAKLSILPETLGNLINLTSLVLKGNSLASLPNAINNLKKLKLLDVSMNSISNLPSISSLSDLATLNISLNQFSGEFCVDGIEHCQKLLLFDCSANSLTSLGSLEQYPFMSLAEVVARQNKLEFLSSDILNNWPSIKRLDLAQNCLKQVPAELGELHKLKELILVENPLSDNRLRKMCGQKGTKSILDYIKAHSCKSSTGEKEGGKRSKKNKKNDQESSDVNDLCNTLTITSIKGEFPEIAVSEAVKEVRPYIIFCFVTELDLSGDKLKKFLSIQTRLHKTVCDNRTLATIATHDLSKVKGPLSYTCKQPDELMIVPLSSPHPTPADKLVTQLKTEAEALRKEKKRSAVTGLHQYLHLLESWTSYPCLTDGDTVVSFPPVTNSGDTRISDMTSSVLIEVTSSTKLGDAKNAMNKLIEEMTMQWGNLKVVQGRVVDEGGSLKVTYPAKTDLVGLNGVNVIRE